MGSATRDIHFEGGADSDMPGFKGVIKKGTVASQHHKWTTWVDGKPLITFHEMYTMDEFDAIEPQPDWGSHYHYRIVIDGDEPTELILQAPPDPQGNYREARLHLDRDGSRERDSRCLRCAAGVHDPQRARTDTAARRGSLVRRVQRSMLRNALTT